MDVTDPRAGRDLAKIPHDLVLVRQHAQHGSEPSRHVHDRAPTVGRCWGTESVGPSATRALSPETFRPEVSTATNAFAGMRLGSRSAGLASAGPARHGGTTASRSRRAPKQ